MPNNDVPDQKRLFINGNAPIIIRHKQKSILILDEFTSSVPENVAIEMENAVLALDHIMVLHITHTLLPEQRAKYDEVITVENHTAQCLLCSDMIHCFFCNGNLITPISYIFEE